MNNMNFIIFLPAILCSVVAAVVFVNSEQEKVDYIGKIWGYVFSMLLIFFTLFLTKKAIEFEKYLPFKPEVEYYNYEY